jgi:hypothetical protein
MHAMIVSSRGPQATVNAAPSLLLYPQSITNPSFPTVKINSPSPYYQPSATMSVTAAESIVKPSITTITRTTYLFTSPASPKSDLAHDTPQKPDK